MEIMEKGGERKGRGKYFGWLTFFLVFVAMPLFGQLPTGTILGVVTDASGGAVAGAMVTAKNLDTGLLRTLTSGSDGSYQFPALPVGNYEVDVTHEGFKTETRTGLTLTVTQQAVVNITLTVGAASQRVEVTAEAPIVDTTSGTLGGLVSEQKVEDLPLNGRNYLTLVLLQTGVNDLTALEGGRDLGLGGLGAGDAVFSSNGGTARSNNYMLDGAILQNMYGLNPSSIAGTTLGVDGIKEFQVITNLFSAEYGLTMGSQTVMVSKGGTNQFHGDAFEFLRNSALDARNYFDPRKIPEFRQNQFGGAFGGPIKKDKTFFYGVYEELKATRGVSTRSPVLATACHTEPTSANNFTVDAACDPSLLQNPPGQQTEQLYSNPAAGCNNCVLMLLNVFPLPTPGLGNNLRFLGLTTPLEHYGQIRVDQNFSSTDTFFARYTVDDASRTSPRSYPGFDDIFKSRSQYVTLSESHIFSPSVINMFRTSFSRTVFAETNIPNRSYSFVTGQPGGLFNIGGSTQRIGPNAQSPGYAKQNILTGSDDVFWNKGKHSLKFGTLINHYEQGQQRSSQKSGTIVFPSLTNFLQGNMAFVSYAPPTADQNRDFRFWTFGFYGQDDIRVNQRFTLNLGLRYEFNTTPMELHGKQNAFRHFATDTLPTQGPIMQNSSLKNFSPRIGFAWDVFGDGKTSVRGGSGLFYDIGTIGSALTDNVQDEPPFAPQAVDGFTPPSFHKLQLPLDVFFPINATGPTPFMGSGISEVNYYAKQPYMLQWNLSIERQLPGNSALRVSYVGSRGIHLWDILEGNSPLPTSIINGDKFWDPFSPTYQVVNPYWGDFQLTDTRGYSWYNSLQVEVTKRLARGLQFQGNYTWGRSLDTPQGQFPGADPTAPNFTDPTNPRTDYGPSEIDITNQMKFNLLYHFPTVKSENSIAKLLLNGWWTGNIVTVQSGYAFSPLLTFLQSNSQANDSNGDRPDVVTAANVAAVRNGTYTRNGVPGGQNPNAVPFNKNTVITGNPNQWFNPNMFIPGPPGFLGNASRGMLRGPGLGTWDFSLVKDTKLPFLGEAGSLEFRAEFFNLLNRTNFRIPDNSTYTSGPSFVSEGVVDPTTILSSVSGTAGQISSPTTTFSREIQFGLKVQF